MFLSIVENRSGHEWLRELEPEDHLDLRRYVREWAEAESDGDLVPAFSEPGAHIPNGCADFQAELCETREACAVCWTCEPFYMVARDECTESGNE